MKRLFDLSLALIASLILVLPVTVLAILVGECSLFLSRLCGGSRIVWRCNSTEKDTFRADDSCYCGDIVCVFWKVRNG